MVSILQKSERRRFLFEMTRESTPCSGEPIFRCIARTSGGLLQQPVCVQNVSGELRKPA